MSRINEIRTSGSHVSYWTESAGSLACKPLNKSIRADVVIIGAGISGLTIGYCLALKGKKAVIVEDGYIGSGESGRTTAHLVTALDDRYYELERIYGERGARLAAESHKAAIQFIEDTIEKEQILCDFDRVNGYLFRHPSDDRDSLEKEFNAVKKTGLEVEMLDKVPGLLKDEGPCLRFPRQGQFHIMKYLNGLCLAFQKLNGEIYTETKAEKIESDGIVTDKGYVVKANHIVVATNTPVNNRFAIHTKQKPYRTYVMGATIKRGVLPKSLWWDTGDQVANKDTPPYHYVRLQDYDHEHDLLICGGEDHVTGITDVDHVSEEKRYNFLENWARERFPIEKIIYNWSGQVMETMDGLAFIGRNPLDADNVYIATGDSGNGMTHGTIAGMLISDLIVGNKNPWKELYDPGRFKIISSGQVFVKDNISFVKEMFKAYTDHPHIKKFTEVQKNEGKVVEVEGDKYGVYRDNLGSLHVVSAVCPHLKCIVKWNNDETSWDCPCHGSRFTVDGVVINGPANSNLSYFHPESVMAANQENS